MKQYRHFDTYADVIISENSSNKRKCLGNKQNKQKLNMLVLESGSKTKCLEAKVIVQSVSYSAAFLFRDQATIIT